MSNTGGREGQGWHQTGLDDVANMLTFMRDQGYGVDPFRMVNLGYSRGGGTALLWGENPLDPFSRNYKSIGVFAMEPPSHGGFISQQAMSSYQAFHYLSINFFNNPNADRYGPGQKIDINPSPILKLLLDQDDPWKADRPQEIYRDGPWRKSSAGYLSRLAGKSVVFGVGTHDAIMPLPMILKLDRTLYHLPHASGDPPPPPILHLTCLTLRTGHNWDSFTCLRAELSLFLDALTAGQPYTVPDGRRYYQAIDLTNHGQEAVPISPPAPPFSIVVPYRMAVHTTSLAQWATLAACGESNQPYEARLIREADGQVVYTTGSKTFGLNTFSDFDFDEVGEPDPECDVIRLDRQPNWQSLLTGTYRWRFTYQGQEINAGNLSYFGNASWGRPTVATTILDPDQPPQDRAIFDPSISISMGVDQF